jgi:sec-independent protein translocase protein TatB
MFDIAWSHLAVIALVALIVIGPKDLPRVMRTVGMWIGKARAIAREFQSSLDQMMREAELDEMRKQVEQATNVNLAHEIERTVDPAGEMQKSLEEPLLPGPTAPAPLPSPPEASAPPETAPSAPPAKSGTHD